MPNAVYMTCFTKSRPMRVFFNRDDTIVSWDRIVYVIWMKANRYVWQICVKEIRQQFHGVHIECKLLFQF